MATHNIPCVNGTFKYCMVIYNAILLGSVPCVSCLSNLKLCTVILSLYDCDFIIHKYLKPLSENSLKWQARHALWSWVRMTSQSMRLKLDLLQKYGYFNSFPLLLVLYLLRFRAMLLLFISSLYTTIRWNLFWIIVFLMR